MHVTAICKNYFHLSFQDLVSKELSVQALAILKIVSYATLIIPLGFGIALGLASLAERISERLPPGTKNVSQVAKKTLPTPPGSPFTESDFYTPRSSLGSSSSIAEMDGQTYFNNYLRDFMEAALFSSDLSDRILYCLPPVRSFTPVGEERDNKVFDLEFESRSQLYFSDLALNVTLKVEEKVRATFDLTHKKITYEDNKFRGETAILDAFLKSLARNPEGLFSIEIQPAGFWSFLPSKIVSYKESEAIEILEGILSKTRFQPY